jgi:16S rRNA (guanine966-N2)-methyltransferase
MIALWLHMTPSSKFGKAKITRTKSPKAGAIRIIAGQHRGRKLPVLASEGLRPTSDRVKETLFNWLMHDIADARVLDMFAGAGSLGFEALSRHAKQVVMVEKDAKAAKQLNDNVNILKAQSAVQVICDDALSALSRFNTPFDIVFVDPPFTKGLAEKAIAKLLEKGLLNPDALIYVETEVALAPFADARLQRLKEKSTSQVSYRLYQYLNC